MTGAPHARPACAPGAGRRREEEEKNMMMIAFITIAVVVAPAASGPATAHRRPPRGGGEFAPRAAGGTAFRGVPQGAAAGAQGPRRRAAARVD